MNARRDGWPAFPVPMVPFEGGFVSVEFTGISLRDYFAAKALQGMLASPYWSDNADGNEHNEMAAAGQAYRMADAMLKAREA